MIHDIPITLGVYAISGREVTESTVAAILTILGYSIYDTIIIFDRIRENMPIMRRASLRDDRQRLGVGDDPAIAGDDLHHAAADRRALLLRRRDAAGLRVRAHGRDHRRVPYSSIFIAAPLLTMWKEREPEYARRKGQDIPEGAAGDRGAPAGRARLLEERTPTTPMDVVEAGVGAIGDGPVDDEAKRAARRQRRRSRPHGRAR